MNTATCRLWRRMVLAALLSSIGGSGMVSSVMTLASPLAGAATLENVDGNHGILTIAGQLVDSPCRLSMESRDQTVDLGTLATADLANIGASSQPLEFMVHLEGCLRASGHLRDARSDSTTWGVDQPVVNVAFMAPVDMSDPSLIKLNGVQGIALRLKDARNHVVIPGSQGVPQLLIPGNNTLRWTIIAERIPGPLTPGAFRAVTDFRLSYD
ncbi:TPA: fimbrial protein [Salmonella enterica]